MIQRLDADRGPREEEASIKSATLLRASGPQCRCDQFPQETLFWSKCDFPSGF